MKEIFDQTPGPDRKYTNQHGGDDRKRRKKRKKDKIDVRGVV